MPNMGRKSASVATRAKPATGLADALFSKGQQRVLGYLFGQPERSFFATELIGLSGGGSGAVQRELQRLADSGLVRVSRVGTQKHYQANPASPIYSELTAIARKTVGLAEPLREALKPFAKRIVAAFVYGSIAKKQDTAASDIDLMVVSDRLTYGDIFDVLTEVSTKLGRKVNPTVYTPREMTKRIKQGNAFVTRVMAQPKIWVIGDESGFAAENLSGPNKQLRPDAGCERICRLAALG